MRLCLHLALTHAAFLLGAAMLACPSAVLAEARLEAREDNHTIPPGRLNDALRQMLANHSIHLVYSPSLVANRMSPGVVGNPPSLEALAQILRGTGLTAVEVSPYAYVLRASTPTVSTFRAAPPSLSAAKPTELESVQVTGTRIPRSSLQTSAPLTILSAEDIRTSGQITLYDVLRQQPNITPHHPRDISTNFGRSLSTPLSPVQSASLHVLGPNATLYLVDGVRAANFGLPSPQFGGVNDLASIAPSMIDRIEIVSGAASAIYGADAMGGVVNILLKRAYQGSEVGTNFGISDRGDTIRHGSFANVGHTTAGGAHWTVAVDRSRSEGLLGRRRPWATLAQSGLARRDQRIPLVEQRRQELQLLSDCVDYNISPSGHICSFDAPRYASLIPATYSHAIYGVYSGDFNTHTSVEASLRISDTKARMQYPPSLGYFYNREGVLRNHAFFDVGPIVSNSASSNLDARLQLESQRSRFNWVSTWFYRRNSARTEVSGAINMETSIWNPYPLEALNEWDYNLDGGNSPSTIANIAPPNYINGTLADFGVITSVSGHLATLPHGRIDYVLGLEARHERLRSNVRAAERSDGYSSFGSWLGEGISDSTLRLSHFGELAVPTSSRTSIDLAWRADRGNQFHTQISPRLGAQWRITPVMKARVSHGLGFRPPSLYELRTPPKQQPVFFREPNCKVSVSGYCVVEVFPHANNFLKPEKSRSTTVGISWSPHAALDLDVEFYNIHRDREITAQYDLSPQSVIRDAQGNATGLSLSFRNGDTTHLRGWQFIGALRASTQTEDRFDLRLHANYLDKWIASGLTSVGDLVSENTPRWHAKASIRWSRSKWSTEMAIRYRSGLRATTKGGYLEPSPIALNNSLWRDLPSMTTADASLRFDADAGWSVGLHALNIADRTPKNFDANFSGYTLADDDSVGRYYLLKFDMRF